MTSFTEHLGRVWREMRLACDIERAAGNSERTALIVTSVGKRPWFDFSLPWLSLYAKRHNYDLIVRFAPSHKIGPPDEIINSIYGRLQKLDIREYFNYYSRLIALDDSCFVSPKTPSLTDIVPEGQLGCVLEENFPLASARLKEYLEKHQTVYGLKTPLPRRRLVNSGVLVMGRRHRKLFEFNSGDIEMILLDPVYADQGFISKRAWELNLPIFCLGNEFNFVGSQIAQCGGAEHAPLSIKIFHLTSYLTDNERVTAAQVINGRFSAELTN